MRGNWVSCHLHVVRKPHETILVLLLKANIEPLSSVAIKTGFHLSNPGTHV